MKRIFDILISFFGLLVSLIIILPVLFLIWVHDKKSPFYIAPRVGRNEKIFKMVKLRSMAVGSDKSGVDSTSLDDNRITPIGRFVRRYKLDELTQLWNVLKGDMSLVGPRPNVKSETDLYTHFEKKILKVKPGITDFSSIVFSDEGEILKGKKDPDLEYNQLIRPWKSRLAIIYVENRTITLDILIIFYTFVALLSKKRANSWVSEKVKALGANSLTVRVALRVDDLKPYPPPGSKNIVNSRGIS